MVIDEEIVDEIQIAQNAKQAESPVFGEDYWSFAQTERWYFPDGVQYIAFQIMNEGQKARFQKSINRDIKINRHSGDASIKTDIADERWELIRNSVTDWNMVRRTPTGTEQVLYNKQMLDKWLQVANPKLVEELELAIRKANPWLNADMTVEEIDKEIVRLKEMRDEVEKREAGEGSFSSK